MHYYVSMKNVLCLSSSPASADRFFFYFTLDFGTFERFLSMRTWVLIYICIIYVQVLKSQQEIRIYQLGQWHMVNVSFILRFFFFSSYLPFFISRSHRAWCVCVYSIRHVTICELLLLLLLFVWWYYTIYCFAFYPLLISILRFFFYSNMFGSILSAKYTL